MPNSFDFLLNIFQALKVSDFKSIGNLSVLNQALPNLTEEDFKKIFNSALSSDLHKAGINDKFYWRSRDDDFEALALGTARFFRLTEWEAFKSATEEFLIKASQFDLRLYGGVAFDKSLEVGQDWNGFEKGEWVLPWLEIGRKKGIYYVQIIVETSQVSELQGRLKQVLENLNDDVNGQALSLETKKVLHFPLKDNWLNIVNDIRKKINQSRLTKLVLARKTEVTVPSQFSKKKLLQKVMGEQVASFIFWKEKNGLIFLGQSPELLFRSKDTHLMSEALAGTRPRHRNELLDKKLEEELIQGKKERLEHLIVLENCQQVFLEVSTAIEVGELKVKKMKRVQHLVQSITGELKNGESALSVLAKLHPTAATAGAPKNEALSFIQSSEGFSRGWYAGAIGWLSAKESEFCVGLRCLLYSEKNNSLCLYAGAGILADSDPESEWEELNDKISQYLN